MIASKSAGGAPDLRRSLLSTVRADPQRLPEALAVFTLRHMGPRAERGVSRLRERHPDQGPAGIRRRVISDGTRRVATEGAFVGGPFILFIPVAFCGALLAQTRLVLELACVAGLDPRAPERAAELLVLQGVYPAVEDAREALSKTRPPRREVGGRLRTLRSLTMRMAYLLGLLTRDEDSPAPGRFVRVARWLVLAVVILVGLVAPLVWLPYMAVSYHRATSQLLARAAALYPEPGGTAAEPPSGPTRIAPGLLAAGVRALLSILVPIGAVVLVLAAGLRLFGGRWPALAVLLVGGSVTVGVLWHARRGRRRTAGGADAGAPDR